jgi:mannose-6-phosphate isomerase
MKSGSVEPVKLRPRLDSKPWGGRRLEQWGIALPSDEPIGEAVLTAPEATVVSGTYAGEMFGDLVRQSPDAWIGPRGFAVNGGQVLFPLLSKLIDTRADLSIQVHPDDAAAAAAGLGTGKTEAYHILAAAPGSVLYLGLDPDAKLDDFAKLCQREDGSSATCLRRIPVEAGMSILIPAGTLHAPGAGITLYEIQQPSTVTFRLDDWGRVDAAGTRRQLHHEEGMAAIDPDSRPRPVPPLVLDPTVPGRQVLVATRYFALERIAIRAGDRIGLAGIPSPRVLTTIRGRAELQTGETRTTIGLGETVVVPVGVDSELTSKSSALVLHAWVPDLRGEILDPARDAGISDTVLHPLGVTL